MTQHPFRPDVELDFIHRCIKVNGTIYKERKPASGKYPYQHNGRGYVTFEEYMLACVLDEQGIPFLYEVDFPFSYPPRLGRARSWSPDFFFGWYKWLGNPCHKSSIVGIEVKGRSLPLGRSQHLIELLDLPVLLMHREHILPLFDQLQKGQLPRLLRELEIA